MKRKTKHNRRRGKHHTKHEKSRKGTGLFGTPPVMEHPVAQTLAKGGLVLLTAIASGGAGAALGKHSLLAGIPLALYGFHKKNTYLIAAGLGFTLSNGFQSKNKKTAAVQGVDGFDVKQLAEEAKERIGTYFKNFSEKLYLPNEETGTAGLAGQPEKEEQVTYFVNPYNNNPKEIDMSAIDRIQEQIANMQSGNRANAISSTNGLNDLEESEREF